MVLGNLRKKYQKYKIKNRYEKLIELSKLSLIYNDTSEEVIQATESLIALSHQSNKYIDMMVYLMDTLDITYDLNPQLISHILEICALPNNETLKKMMQKMTKKIQQAKKKEESERVRGVSAIIFAIWSEKLAGKASESIFEPQLIQSIMYSIQSDFNCLVQLYSILSLENFCLTDCNKERLIDLGYKQLLLSFLNNLNMQDPLAHSLEFCILNSKVDFLGRELLTPMQIHNLFKGIHCVLDWSISSSFLKFSDDLCECRNDRIGFATAIATTCVTDGKWYYEVLLISGGIMQIGWTTQSAIFKPEDGVGIGDEIHSFGYDGLRNLNWYKGESTLYGITSWKAGDTLGIFLDLEKGCGYYTLNGEELGGYYYMEPGDIQRFCENEGGLRAGISLTSYQQVKVNFGSVPFKYAPKEDFQLLNDYGQLTKTMKLGPYFQNLKLNEEEPNLNDKCQICFLNDAKFKLIPCNHDALCMECINRMPTCPFCRLEISSWIIMK